MNPLQYTSEEMFSSTELIRKSKKVFDKLQKDEIEKAIILRDGKPAFMLLDFSVYEEIMSEYLSLKEILNNKESNSKKKEERKEVSQEKNAQLKNELLEESCEIKHEKKLDEKDLEEALAQIESLNLSDISDASAVEEEEPLKDFWEK